ncbi:hypothetical protein ACWGN5_40180 [Streptomyces sp. NPDC055815]
MAKWWKFGLGRKKEEGAAPEPSPEPTPTPAPAPEPTPPAREKKPGLLGRIFGRKKKPAEAPPAPPEAPPAPPAPPTPPPAPPAAEAPVPEGEQGELFGPAEVGGEEEEEEERQFPASLGVSADGVWKISKTLWDGIMQGVLTGEDVKEFILAMEAGNLTRAAELVADAYDETVGALLDAEGSTIRHIGY